MNCQSCEPLLLLRLDDELSPEQQREVEAHLADCACCRQEWVALQEMLYGLADLPLVSAPDDAWERLEAELFAPESLAPEAPSPPASPLPEALGPWQKLWQGLAEQWLYGAALVGACGLLLLSLPRQTIEPDTRTQPGAAKAKPSAGKKAARAPSMAKAAAPSNRRLAKPDPQAEVRAALKSLAQAQALYQKSIAALERIAVKRIQRRGPAGHHLKQMLAQLDRSIARCRAQIQRSPAAPEPHRILLAVYQRKVEFLRDVVLGEI